MPERKKLLQVKHLKQYFTSGKSTVKAVDDVTFDIYEGETFGLVGESGSGKTTTGRSIIRLYDPTDGEIIFDGKDVSKLKTRSEKLEFNREMQMIFQDPYASLNPRMTVGSIIAEGMEFGLFTHVFYVDSDMSRARDVFMLAREYPVCTFFMLIKPDLVTDDFLLMTQGVNNVIISVHVTHECEGTEKDVFLKCLST